MNSKFISVLIFSITVFTHAILNAAALSGRDLRLTYRDFDGSQQPYRLYVPSGYDATRAFPLIVALHGARGDQNTFFENPAYLKHPIAEAAEKRGAFVLCPYGRGPKEYRGIGEHDVFAALEEVTRQYKIDRDRIYVTGHSMGGTGAAYLALHHPDVFAAAASLSASYGWPWLAPNAGHVPFWWISGAQDKPVFVLKVEETVDVMKDLHLPIRFTLLPDVGHYGAVDDMEMVVNWLLEHRLARLPRAYRFVVDTPLHGQAYWTRVDALEFPGRLAKLDARIDGTAVSLLTDNVRHLSILAEPELMPFGREMQVRIGEREVFRGKMQAGQELQLAAGGGSWSASLAPLHRRALSAFHDMPVGKAPRPLSMAGVEAPLANWITDAMRAATGTEIAMMNRMYYRGSAIPAGTVDMNDILDAIGVHDWLLVTTRLSGRDLIDILDANVPDPALDRHYVKDGPEADRLIQISGAHYTFDRRKPPGKRIVSTDIEPNRVYTVTCDGAYGTLLLIPERLNQLPVVKTTDIPFSAALYGHTLRAPEIAAAIEGRVRDVEVESGLDAQISSMLKGFRGSVGIYAKDLTAGTTYAYHADELFATASWFKLPVMIELFRRAEAGELRLTDRRRPPATASRYGGGILKILQDSPELSLLDYCRVMIMSSDNLATDTLMELIQPEAVTATMARLGFPNTRVSGNVTLMHYRMAGIDATAASPETEALLLSRADSGQLKQAGFADRSIHGNVTTAREAGQIFEKLYKGEIVSKAASEQMIEILKQNMARGRLAGHLPAQMVVAHKHGATWRVKTDAGIIYSDRGPIVVSVFTYADPEETRANEIIASVSELLVRSAAGRVNPASSGTTAVAR